MKGKRMAPWLVAAGLSLTGLVGTGVYADDEPGQLTEARIEGQLWGVYAVNRELNPYDLDIEVSGSTVTLSGVVDQDAKKSLAEEIASNINGVTSVDNRIEVRPDVERASESDDRSFGQVVGDATTTATVKTKLLMDSDVGGLDINVSTERSVVTLEGEAETVEESRRAESLAAETDGVARVVNRIVVR